MLLSESIHRVFIDAVRAEYVIAVETSVDGIIVTMSTKYALRWAGRAVSSKWRSARREISRLGGSAVAENIDRVRWVDAIIVKRIDSTVGAASVERIQNVGKQTVTIHDVMFVVRAEKSPNSLLLT